MRKHAAFLTTTGIAIGLSLMLTASSHAQEIGLSSLGGISIGGLDSGSPSVGVNTGSGGSAGISASPGGGSGPSVSASANGGGGTGGGGLSAGLGGAGANAGFGNGGGLNLGVTTPSVSTPGIPGIPGTPSTPGGTRGSGVTGNNSFAPGSAFSQLSSADIRRFRIRCMEVTANPFSYDRNLVAMCRLLQQSAMR